MSSRKIPVQPICVSKVQKVPVDGDVFCCNLIVRYDGDLAMWHNENPLPQTVQQFKKFMKWTDAYVKKLEDEEDVVNGGHKSIERLFFEFRQELAEMYSVEKLFVLNPDLDIPKFKNVSTVKWDAKSVKGDNKYANTLVGYVFFEDFLSLKLCLNLAESRAENFRNKILAQIAEKKNENTK